MGTIKPVGPGQKRRVGWRCRANSEVDKLDGLVCQADRVKYIQWIKWDRSVRTRRQRQDIERYQRQDLINHQINVQGSETAKVYYCVVIRSWATCRCAKPIVVYFWLFSAASPLLCITAKGRRIINAIDTEQILILEARENTMKYVLAWLGDCMNIQLLN